LASRVESELSDIALIQAGVRQGAIMTPFLYIIYSSDQQIFNNTLVADYADDKAILTAHSDPIIATQNLQAHINELSDWYSKWRFKVNKK